MDVDVDHGQLVGRHLNRFAIVMDLHELAPVDRRATGGRDGRRLERLTEVCEGLTSRGRSHPGLLPLANLRFEVSRLLPAVFSEPDITTTPRALERKLLPHPGHEFRPRNPRGVVRAELLMRVAAAFRGVTVAPMPAGHRLVALSDVPDRQRRDGAPERVGLADGVAGVCPVLLRPAAGVAPRRISHLLRRPSRGRQVRLAKDRQARRLDPGDAVGQSAGRLDDACWHRSDARRWSRVSGAPP